MNTNTHLNYQEVFEQILCLYLLAFIHKFVSCFSSISKTSHDFDLNT